MRGHILRGLSEDSRYTITVMAIKNGASTMETVTAATMISGMV
jgi:hypothetical protein